MSLPVPHIAGVEYQVDGWTPSIGTSPVVAEIHAPFRGRVTKVGHFQMNHSKEQP